MIVPSIGFVPTHVNSRCSFCPQFLKPGGGVIWNSPFLCDGTQWPTFAGEWLNCTTVSLPFMAHTQIYKGDPRPHIPPCVIASSAMGLKLEVFRYLSTTHAKKKEKEKKNVKQICPRSLCIVRRFTCVYLHAQTTVDAGDRRTWQTSVILIAGKTWRSPIWAPCQFKNGACSGDLPCMSMDSHLILLAAWKKQKKNNVHIFSNSLINMQKHFMRVSLNLDIFGSCLYIWTGENSTGENNSKKVTRRTFSMPFRNIIETIILLVNI